MGSYINKISCSPLHVGWATELTRRNSESQQSQNTLFKNGYQESLFYQGNAHILLFSYRSRSSSIHFKQIYVWKNCIIWCLLWNANENSNYVNLFLLCICGGVGGVGLGETWKWLVCEKGKTNKCLHAWGGIGEFAATPQLRVNEPQLRVNEKLPYFLYFWLAKEKSLHWIISAAAAATSLQFNAISHIRAVVPSIPN